MLCDQTDKGPKRERWGAEGGSRKAHSPDVQAKNPLQGNHTLGQTKHSIQG
jgi:hypothetical protein